MTQEFDWFQMEELSLARERGIDPAPFEKPELSHLIMRELRLGLEEGVDLSKFCYLDAESLREIRKGRHYGLFMENYLKEGYRGDQLRELRRALAKKIDIEKYVTSEYRGKAIKEIATGLEHGIDVSVYCDVNFNFRQMQEIRLGLEHHIDSTVYSNPLYDFNQMQEIRLGLEDGIDVSEYKSFVNTAGEMKKRRMLLTSGKAYELRRAERLGSINEKLDEVHGVIFKVSTDGMGASCIVTDAVHLSEEEFTEQLKKRGIVRGIDTEAVRRICSSEITGGEVIIAKGEAPVTGSDGYYEYDFKLKSGSPFEAKIQIVKKGQRIAAYHPAGEGRDGYSVDGEVIKGRRGKQLPILMGEGIVYEKNTTAYVAAYDGCIHLCDDKINITPILRLESIKASSEKIEFDGIIYVSGNVFENNELNAKECIIVDGTVYSSKLICDGDVIIKRGVTSAYKGGIEAGGNVCSGFIEETYVVAGKDIMADSVVNSELSAGEHIILTGRFGRIYGGSSYGGLGIRASVMGTDAGNITHLRAGVTEEMKKKLSEAEVALHQAARELEILYEAYSKYITLHRGRTEFEMNSALRLEKAIFTKKTEYEDCKIRKEKIEEDIKVHKAARITASVEIRGNLDVVVNMEHVKLEVPMEEES